MSELRKIKVRLDIDLLKKVADKLGATVKEKGIPNSYATKTIECDYVINYKGFEFGIKDTELVYDDMFGYKLAEFLNIYMEEVLKSKHIRYKKIETNREYVYLIS